MITACEGGGFFALSLERRKALVLAFSAGAVIGVALFDLTPEAVELAGPSAGAAVFALVGAGYAAYHLIHRGAQRAAGGTLGAATLTLHSVLDGLSIGFSFQVSVAAGAAAELRTAATATVAASAKRRGPCLTISLLLIQNPPGSRQACRDGGAILPQL